MGFPEYLERATSALALVVDDKDPDELSRVKVRVLPLMKDIDEADLPWAEPINYFLGHSADTGEHRPPEIGTEVFVLITKRGTNFYYTHDAYIEGFALYGKFPAGDIEGLGSQTYPQPRFKLYKDGSVHFVNTDTAEQGVFTSSGTTVLIDSDGNVIVDSPGDVTVTAGGELVLDNGSGTITLKSSGQVDVNGNLTVDP